MNALDRIALLLIGALAGSAATLLVMGLGGLWTSPQETHASAVAATVLAVMAMIVALSWIGGKRRRRSR